MIMVRESECCCTHDLKLKVESDASTLAFMECQDHVKRTTLIRIPSVVIQNWC